MYDLSILASMKFLSPILIWFLWSPLWFWKNLSTRNQFWQYKKMLEFSCRFQKCDWFWDILSFSWDIASKSYFIKHVFRPRIGNSWQYQKNFYRFLFLMSRALIWCMSCLFLLWWNFQARFYVTQKLLHRIGLNFTLCNTYGINILYQS